MCIHHFTKDDGHGLKGGDTQWGSVSLLYTIQTVINTRISSFPVTSSALTQMIISIHRSMTTSSTLKVHVVSLLAFFHSRYSHLFCNNSSYKNTLITFRNTAFFFFFYSPPSIYLKIFRCRFFCFGQFHEKQENKNVCLTFLSCLTVLNFHPYNKHHSEAFTSTWNCCSRSNNTESFQRHF